MDGALAREVWDRAQDSCEYCLIGEEYFPAPFEIDHVIARQHGGKTILGNLALSCFHCNSHKGPNIAGIDPVSQKMVRLFNPRRHRWNVHFRWDGAVVVGRTPIGRATIQVLNMNGCYLVGLREELMAEGLFPAQP
jgi:hypothetical protein